MKWCVNFTVQVYCRRIGIQSQTCLLLLFSLVLRHGAWDPTVPGLRSSFAICNHSSNIDTKAKPKKEIFCDNYEVKNTDFQHQIFDLIRIIMWLPSTLILLIACLFKTSTGKAKNCFYFSEITLELEFFVR